jgi:hypothetical protein
MLGLRVLGDGRAVGGFDQLVLLGQYGGKGRVDGLGNSCSYFLEGMKELGTKSEVNALFRVGLSAVWTIVVVLGMECESDQKGETLTRRKWVDGNEGIARGRRQSEKGRGRWEWVVSSEEGGDVQKGKKGQAARLANRCVCA